MSADWTRLQDLAVPRSYNNLKRLNDNVFICYEHSDSYPQNHLDIHQYDQVSDQWTKCSYPVSRDWNHNLSNFCIDIANECIYVYTTNGKLYAINAESNAPKLILEGLPNYDNPGQMLFVDGKIVVMAGNSRGFKINIDATSTNPMQFTEISRSGNFRFHPKVYSYPYVSKYIKSQNYVLNIVADLYDGTHTMHKYSLIDDKVSETGFIFSCNSNVSNIWPGYVLSKNQRYLIILGGYDGFHGKFVDDIELFDLEEGKLIQCKLKCPFKNGIQAINMGSDDRDELLVCGYVRKLWKLTEFRSMNLFPKALFDVILDKVSIEYIHIISHEESRSSPGNDALEHWKINIDHIFDSIIID